MVERLLVLVHKLTRRVKLASYFHGLPRHQSGRLVDVHHRVLQRVRLERFPVHGVVLLGDCEGGWLEPAVFADLDVVSTVSVRGMLRHPELKVQAWRDLKRLAATGA